MKRAITVEIHDVTPALWPEVHAIHTTLEAAGIPRPTLLVVPEYQDSDGRRWGIRDHHHFVQWLQKRQDAGCELIQHGLTHRASGPPPRGLKNAWLHHVFSRGQAEFAHLNFHEAKNRVAIGQQLLLEVGLHCEGFVAPAWQQSLDTLDALRDSSFRYTAFMNSLLPLDWPERPEAAPALSFAAGHLMVDRPKRVYMRIIEQLAASEGLLRVCLHPEDMRRHGLVAHILQRIAHLRKTRSVSSYAQWLQRREQTHVKTAYAAA